MVSPEAMAEAVEILTALTLADDDEATALAARVVQESPDLPALTLTLAALMSEAIESLDDLGILSPQAFLQCLGMQAAS